MTRKIKYACLTCGSEEIAFDATAEWDVEAQCYVVSTLFDGCFCGSDACQGEERRVQEYDADSGEALATGPGSFEYILKEEADAAWADYHEQREAERQDRERDLKQEQIIAENVAHLSVAVQEMFA